MNLKKKKAVLPLDGWPAWFDGKSINEALFCQHFLKTHDILYTENAFFTPEGCMTDDAPLKADIYAMLEDYASTSVTKKISSIIELLKILPHRRIGFTLQTERSFWMVGLRTKRTRL